jgi:ABC-type nitrate/sulfonate/bicarbonate transport system substrate-binding protein
VSMIPNWLRRAAHAGAGEALEKTRLNLGFIPLTDCAPLVIAKEKGWFAKYGLDVNLSKETSWANVRDKVAIGILDGAQMLAPMPIASTLGIGPVEKPTVTALSLDLNGNAITVSQALFEQMRALDQVGMTRRPFGAGPLRQVIAERAARGEPPLTFAVVFPVSTHAYQLRYWMGAAGIDPDRDVRLLVVPPPQMVSQLKAGHVDGFCVGEPWNQAAVAQGLGRVLITSYELWNNGPEKVLGVNQEWAEQYPNTHRAVLMALLEAARWLDGHENRPEVVDILSRPAYVNAPREVVGMSMTGTFLYGPGEDPVVMPDFNCFFRFAATFPWCSHAEWFMTQMLRWGQIEQPQDIVATAARVYRPEIYREAASALGLAVPTIDSKPEGVHGRGWILEQASEPLAMGPDRFFDGMTFDPADPLAYVAGFPMHRRALAVEDLARLSGGAPTGPGSG